MIVNAAISAYNAYSVGRSWADAKVIGGWQKIVVWSAAIMSACGFTWCYLVIYAFVAMTFNLADPQLIEAAFNLGYVMIIFPIIGSGMAIWIHSVIVAYRERSAASVGVAAWNTFAQAYNIYGAFRGLPDILKSLGEFFKGGDSKGKVIRSHFIFFSVSMFLVSALNNTRRLPTE